MVDAEDMVDVARSRDSVDRPLGKKELRRLARQQRKAEETERQERARRRRMGIFAAAGLLALSGVAWGGGGAVRADSTSTPPRVTGQPKLNVNHFPQKGRGHIFPRPPAPALNPRPPT